MASRDFAFKWVGQGGARASLRSRFSMDAWEEALATHEATLRDLEVYQFTNFDR
jgi:hypothetical protein